MNMETEFRRRAERIVGAVRGVPGLHDRYICLPQLPLMPPPFDPLRSQPRELGLWRLRSSFGAGCPSIDFNPSTGGKPGVRNAGG